MKRAIVIWSAIFFLALSMSIGAAAEDISGAITTTRIITENSRLVGDVTCSTVLSPCIAFGAPHITLRLNGFTITGNGNPDAAASDATQCDPAGAPLNGSADIISIVNPPPAPFDQVVLTDDRIIGPGMVQMARHHGMLLANTSGVTVRRVTSNSNCYSGLFMSNVSNSTVEEIVSVRNAGNSGLAPCGGNCVVNSHNNHIFKNEFSGNGSVMPINNDFGLGLRVGSSGNVVENNNFGGNSNGILIEASATDNVIRENIIAGNPPVQVSRAFGAAVGADIFDQSTIPGSGSRNTIENNLCITYSGPGPSPCPNLPAVTIQHDADQDNDRDGDDR